MLWKGGEKWSRRLRAIGRLESRRHTSGATRWKTGVVGNAMLPRLLTANVRGEAGPTAKRRGRAAENSPRRGAGPAF